MKTFKDLKLNDKVIIVPVNPSTWLPHKDKYGRVYDERCYKVITVQSLSLSKDHLILNNDRYDRMHIPILNKDEVSFDIGGETIIADKNEARRIIKEKLVKRFADIRKEVMDYIATKDNEVKELREVYYDYLN